jgi:hypothetical protein
MDCTERKVVEDNLSKMKENSEEGENELTGMKKERNLLNHEVYVLKQVQKVDQQMMKIRQQKWDEQRKDLKEGRRSLNA